MNSLRRRIASLSLLLPTLLVLPTLLGLVRGSLWAGLWGSWLLGGYLLFGGSAVARIGIVGGMLCGVGFGVFLCSYLQRRSSQLVQSLSWLTGYAIAASTSAWWFVAWKLVATSLLQIAPFSMFCEACALWGATALLSLVPFVFALLASLFWRRLFDSDRSASENPNVPGLTRSELFGAALGLMFLFPEVSRVVGWTPLNLAGACAAIGLIFAQILKPSWRAAPRTGNAVSYRPRRRSMFYVAGAGVLWVAVERGIVQLFPATTEIFVSCVGATILGIACGGLSSRQKPGGFLSRIRLSQESEAFLWSILSVAAIAAFPLGVRYSIWVNQTFSDPWWVYVSRMLPACVALVPVGAMLGAACSPGENHDSSRKTTAAFVMTGLVLFAFCWTVGSGILPMVGVVSLVGLAVALAIASLCIPGDRGELNLQPMFAMAGSIVCLVLTLTAFRTYQPTDAALWIAASRSPEARSAGIGNPIVPHLTDLHLVGERRGLNGNLTLWNSREAGLQLWENGVPVSTFSAETGIHPDYSGELLLGLLPLVLHPSSDRVLLLGLGGASPLVAALDAPVRQIDCIEKDVAGIELVRQAFREGSSPDWQDSRLRMINVDPFAWLAGSREKYDVVISNSAPVAFPEGASSFTKEYYRQASQRMAEGGLFCQRLQCFDFGFEPFAQAVATLREVFQNVLVVETAASDFLLFGSNDPRGIVRQDFLDRMQAPQVSKTMSRLGWDSLLAVTIPTADMRALQQIVPAGTRTLSGIDGRIAFAWPREISRTGNKSDELHRPFTGKAGKLIDLVAAEGENRVVLRRLGEIQTQNDLILKYPDQYWSYRKIAREEVSKNPKTLISRIDFEVTRGNLDAEDRRRMTYFALLGRAAKSLDPEHIRRLEQFLTPFDPLLTPFIPQEIAELYARAGNPNPQEELRHRLHRIYYSGPGDRSVIYVVDALDLIHRHPESIPDATRRWYAQSSLLQVLKQRWDVRMTGKPGLPRIMYRDAQLSRAMVEQTLAGMRENHAVAGVTREENSRRAAAIQKLLVQALQNYSRSLAPYLTPSEMANMGSASKSEEQPSESPGRRAETSGGVQAN